MLICSSKKSVPNGKFYTVSPPFSPEMDWRPVPECVFLQVLYIWEHSEAKRDHVYPALMTSAWKWSKKSSREQLILFLFVVVVSAIITEEGCSVVSVLLCIIHSTLCEQFYIELLCYDGRGVKVLAMERNFPSSTLARDPCWCYSPSPPIVEVSEKLFVIWVNWTVNTYLYITYTYIRGTVDLIL